MARPVSQGPPEPKASQRSNLGPGAYGVSPGAAVASPMASAGTKHANHAPEEASAALTAARARLAAERERNKRASEPPRRRAPGDTYRPTPTRAEANYTAVTRIIVARKEWDLSPVDQMSFDPFEPPGPVAPPVNTAPPSIVSVDDTFAVGSQLIGQQGGWSGSPTYRRTWLRGSTPIWAATGVSYVLTEEDVGSMIGMTVLAVNTGGQSTADAAPVGPVEVRK